MSGTREPGPVLQPRLRAIDAEGRLQREAELDALFTIDRKKRTVRRWALAFGFGFGVGSQFAWGWAVNEFLRDHLVDVPLFSFRSRVLFYSWLTVSVLVARAMGALLIKVRTPSWAAALAKQHGVSEEMLRSAGGFEQPESGLSNSGRIRAQIWKWRPF